MNKIKELEEKTKEPNFWDNPKTSEEIFKEISELKEVTINILEIKEKIEECLELIDLIKESFDQEIYDTVVSISKELPAQLEKTNTMLLLNGPYDKSDCIIEVHSGAGGTESCDWANMLYRMYSRYCEKSKFKVNLIDYQAGDSAGIKSVSFEVKGINAYGYLKNEKGVHRLIRLSPFDSSNRRHTSFASIDIMPEVENDLSIEINEKDLKIDVYRSSGAGGQSVNTTDSAVRITHLPTNTVVTCQNERSQIQNKEQAMKVLKSKLLLLKIEEAEKEVKNIKGEQKNIEFGSQIRSYVMHPYMMVKDHRTNYETSNVNKVLDGDINEFIESALKGGI